jgi:hypothetical protein
VVMVESMCDVGDEKLGAAERCFKWTRKATATATGESEGDLGS